mgnify:CR=1 FL=1
MEETFEEFLNTEYPARKHKAHATYTEADMRKAFLIGLGKRHHKEMYENYKDANGMTAYQRLRLSREAKRVAGRVNALSCAQTNGIGIDNVRTVIEGIYAVTDKIVEITDQIEKEIKENEKNRN